VQPELKNTLPSPLLLTLQVLVADNDTKINGIIEDETWVPLNKNICMTESANEFINGIGQVTRAAKKLLKPSFGTTVKLIPLALEEVAASLQRFILRMETEIRLMPPHPTTTTTKLAGGAAAAGGGGGGVGGRGGGGGYEREYAACANALATKREAAQKIFAIFAEGIVGSEVRLTSLDDPQNEWNWSNRLEDSYKQVSVAVAAKMARSLYEDAFDRSTALERYQKVSKRFVGMAVSESGQTPLAPSSQVVKVKDAIKSIPQGRILKFMDER
jgi:hypothetical protein